MATVTFPDKKINLNKLTAFGFHPRDDHYVYQTPLLNQQFTLTVTTTDTNALTTHLLDAASGDEYVLHLSAHANGEFVGQVRAAYQAELQKIEAACFDTAVFQGPAVLTLLHYIQATYGDQPEFLWKKFPRNAVLRRADTHKWYGALLTVDQTKLGLPDAKEVTVLDLRADPATVAALVAQPNYFPGYHMNKKNWFTVILDETTNLEKLSEYIVNSYALAQ